MAYKFNGIGGLMDIMLPVKQKHEFLQANDKSITIRETLSHTDNCMKNNVWLRGDVNELKQFYQKMAIGGKVRNFWGKTSDSSKHDINRIHSGLPARMVKAMAYVCLGDMRDITFESEADTELWKEIAKENHFNNLIDEALKKVLALGDGCFKLSFEDLFTEKPIIEFYSAEEVEYVRHRGRIQEVIFTTKYTHNSTDYFLKERYGYGYILNKLYKDNIEVPLSTIPETAELHDVGFAGGEVKNGEVLKKGEYKLAIPFMIYSSSRYPGRGESIFDERETLFAALDQDLSQWQESVEAGSPNTFVDSDLLKYNPDNGTYEAPSDLTRFYVMKKGRDAEGNSGGGHGIETVQFDIPWQSYYETHSSFLDTILMGFMSPATLGIDVGKVDSGESVREKQTMTMHTRSYIVEIMSEIVKELATIAVQSFYDYWKINQIATEPNVDFGDYCSPTADAKADTIVKCKQGGFMSTQTAVEEYHGDSKTPEWIAEEVARIKEEQGIASMNEPSFGDYSFLDNTGNEDVEDVEDNEEELEDE